MTKELTGQGGKGSVRRNEDTQKVLDGMTRIFGESKLDRKLRLEREEKEAMNEIHDDEYDDEDQLCDWCNGTGEGRHESENCPKCRGTGMMPREDVDDDYI